MTEKFVRDNVGCSLTSLEDSESTVWDNCKTIHIPPGELKDLIKKHIQGKLTEKEQEELIVDSIEICTGGHCENISHIIKVFLCEPQFKGILKNKQYD